MGEEGERVSFLVKKRKKTSALTLFLNPYQQIFCFFFVPFVIFVVNFYGFAERRASHFSYLMACTIPLRSLALEFWSAKA